MCGIFGILTSDRDATQSILEKAARSLAHRGPDDAGTAVIKLSSAADDYLGFAHTRLAIIDLSPLGHQPMHDPSNGNCIVFNGEIYNFRALRSELEGLGNAFVSHSDTEVILTAYRMWGEEAFDRLRGMFSIALWDHSRQRLLLVRDPMGIKPLYYHRGRKGFLFASEVRTLLQTDLIPRRIDPNGLLSFLAFGSVYEPWTIVEGISAVPPGQIVDLHEGRLDLREYCNPLRNSRHDLGSQSLDHARELPQLLRQAVLSHLVSDVPVGVFLSGGIDSSSLVAIMSHAGIRPATFSLVFHEEQFNEAEHSRTVARQFDSDHHEILISETDALAAMPDALRSMDQPTIDGINSWLVSAKTRAAGIKVALSGLGADEMFAGYSNFRRVPNMERAVARLARLPKGVRRPVAASIAAVTRQNDRSRKFAELAADGNTSVHPYFLARGLFTPTELKALFAHNYRHSEHELQVLLRQSVIASQGFDEVNRISYLESTCYMRNTLLRDSDFMSMAHGLELRVPFLDQALVEACFCIPGKDKLRGASPKSLLLNSLGVELPREIVHRPKRGFTLPFERWLRSEMRPLVETAFLGDDFVGSCLSLPAIKDVWRRFLAGQTSWSRPWSLFVLDRWCRQNL